VNLNNGDNNQAYCSAFWLPPIKIHSWLPSCIAAWINNELMFSGDLFVTIAEIHTLIIDVCVCLDTIFFQLIWSYGFNWKCLKWYAPQWLCCYNSWSILTHELKLSSRNWFLYELRSNGCEIMIVKTQPTPSDHLFTCSSGWYNSDTVAKTKCKVPDLHNGDHKIQAFSFNDSAC